MSLESVERACGWEVWRSTRTVPLGLLSSLLRKVGTLPLALKPTQQKQLEPGKSDSIPNNPRYDM